MFSSLLTSNVFLLDSVYSVEWEPTKQEGNLKINFLIYVICVLLFSALQTFSQVKTDMIMYYACMK